jgi:hypothetical protein
MKKVLSYGMRIKKSLPRFRSSVSPRLRGSRLALYLKLKILKRRGCIIITTEWRDGNATGRAGNGSGV